MKELIIQVETLSKSFELKNPEKPVVALDNISFEVFEGDKVGLIGLNGSGKSTLLKILSGHIKPTSGSATLYRNVHSLSHFDSLLHPDLTGVENIEMQLRMLKISRSEIKALVDEVIAFSELGDFIHQPVKTYSSGMMLRLSFSVFKAVKPEILLLDEVFSAGDMIFRRKSDALMKHHLKEIPAIILASHEMAEIAKYCNRCIVLNEGRIVFNGTIDEAIQRYIEENEEKSEPQNTNVESLELLTSKTVPEKNVFQVKENIEVKLEYLKKTEENVDLVIYIRSNLGPALTDCEIYREEFSRTEQPVGKYEQSFTIPAHLLNVGHYMIDLAFGNGTTDVLIVEGAIKFEIAPDPWEKDRLWNINPIVPTRPHLEWTKRLIE